MTDDWDRIDAADWLLDRLESADEVAYATVGAVRQQQRSITLHRTEERSTGPIDTTGVWCTVFVDGSAAYRFTSSLTEETLEELATNVRRSARLLGQDTPSRYDPDVIHRDSHPGWGAGELQRETDWIDPLRTQFDALRDRDGARMGYQRRLFELSVLTSTGSAVRTVLDRGAVTASVDTEGGRLRTHVGTTTGDEVVGRAGDAVKSLTNALERRDGFTAGQPDSFGRRSVVLGPIAAGQFVHSLSHFFEMDQRYMGARPFERGEQIAPKTLTIRDLVVPGSWGAAVYDAEARPTQPVTLVDGGVVTSFLHDTETALEEGTTPTGNVVFPLGFDNPPRIHARHLDVEAGGDHLEELLDGAAVYVDRFGPPQLGNQATRAKRQSWTPVSTLYAKNARKHTPDRYDESNQPFRLRVADGYRVTDGDLDGVLTGSAVEFSPSDLQTLTGVGQRRETVTGTCSKHKSMLPYAVTAPALSLTAEIADSR